jgi:hypothetical protein
MYEARGNNSNLILGTDIGNDSQDTQTHRKLSKTKIEMISLAVAAPIFIQLTNFLKMLRAIAIKILNTLMTLMVKRFKKMTNDDTFHSIHFPLGRSTLVQIIFNCSSRRIFIIFPNNMLPPCLIPRDL